jgi:hypothetical protein
MSRPVVPSPKVGEIAIADSSREKPTSRLAATRAAGVKRLTKLEEAAEGVELDAPLEFRSVKDVGPVVRDATRH